MNNQNKDDIELISNNKSDLDLKQKKYNSNKKFYRSTNKKVFGGVCSGLADNFDVSVLLVRILWLILSLFFVIGFIIYSILWITIPNKKKLESDLDTANIDSNQDKSKATIGVVKNIFSLLGLIIAGCLLGLWGGWEYGQTLQSKGSIITLMIAISSSVVGGIIGAIVGTIIVSKNN
ncbi:hypothetical protein BTO04_02305 [Polaribacter sp. SA4-10]|uniref:PspC domain-containing protein n=1 Tax=Polaribacter sp. SA4-10 TaxID=754397 RepID=UPI000B3C8683|nr:PspC domain-containing protein [Polaribacter sp. SA4-10]ARV05600.1 hypothetical protein BTO04_02305 [Polaribacter sp. SA4-10]